MKALLVVDRRFIRDGAKAWLTEGPKGPETGERYLEWFDEVTVAGRQGNPAAVAPKSLNRIESPNLDIKFLPNLSGLKNRALNFSNAHTILKSLIRESDCIIARLPGELPLEAAKLALNLGKPLAIDLAGCTLDGLRAHGSIQGKIYAPFSYNTMRSVVQRSSWVSYVTRDFLQRRYPAATNATTVSCSNVDIGEPERAILERRIAQIEEGQRPLVFGTIGSLYGKFKGIQDAIVALAHVAHELPAFQYRVLGGGDPTPLKILAQEQGIAERVLFDGTLPAGEPVHRWLDGIDIYLHPSLREGLPRALIEAMSRACPAVASSIAGTPELLAADNLYRPGKVSELKRLILRSVDSSWQRKNAEVNWRQAKAYSSEVVGEKRRQFWRAFADHVRSRSSRGPGGASTTLPSSRE